MSTMRLKERPTMREVALPLNKGISDFFCLSAKDKSICVSRWVFLHNMQLRSDCQNTPSYISTKSTTQVPIWDPSNKEISLLKTRCQWQHLPLRSEHCGSACYLRLQLCFQANPCHWNRTLWREREPKGTLL